MRAQMTGTPGVRFDTAMGGTRPAAAVWPRCGRYSPQGENIGVGVRHEGA
jgi:hypothetical protein